ncbi:ribosome silencing factor [Hydrogenophaga atypica]|uniref:Ribosomal silencing factor RsfS n=1 Tax=Hydrogenophaga atypica TaxID=249409 RepID=A0ABW2QPG4_9BURK
MTSETTANKNTQKLQRAIVDGLEDVKAQDIVVFNTEHLSPLFERVVVASGTSNRQTKALAASVRDAVREAGFPKPRTEGEENGEWIIVDCGAAVVHVMQPAIRQYYRLEEIWGEKPVRLKHGAAKPVVAEKPAGKKPAAKKTAAKAPVAAVPAKKVAAKVAKAAAAAKVPAKAPSKASSKTPSKSTAKPAAKAPAKKSAVKPATKGAVAKAPVAKKPATKAPVKVVKVNAPAKKAAAKKAAPARKPAAKSTKKST